MERLLTGDRVTGKLHLGHYVGSLKNRVELQSQVDSLIMLADVQALTTHFEQPDQLAHHLKQVTLDYLSVGIDPNQSTIFVQSMIPEIAELTVYFSMFVTINSLRHNPTIKAEAKENGYEDLYYGFLGYPISQTADITFCKATVVPVGEDQLPHMEQTRKIIRRFNQLYAPIFQEPQAVVGEFPRLIGLDGSSKMSKTKGNTINLDATKEEVHAKIKKATTDPARVRKSDPGHPEVCPIYSYHQAFRKEAVTDIYDGCTNAKLGCVECKQMIAASINHLLEPMRERRNIVLKQPRQIDEILEAGTARARNIGKQTMEEVREAMSMSYFRRDIL
ncbi:tryptophan--tRNA ligase [Alkalicoccobacillus plakortidis]|uniref:Tryptophan--tRNA ligase n=1 Tax=Alkalicoccobacillus plakortidis TaxID=444060 RepID=A0ABT0XF06_9BACI|nr:tryptophan--tRNA ligase [Alkalicoccobacillus plakortidis]MCM2674479.1 tryptophan--tRNA ligase [Alkalicoccobacillus plakortidis]